MSTRKDVPIIKTSSTTKKKMPSTTAKPPPARERENSKDRKKKAEVQSSEKSKVKQATISRVKISDKTTKSSDSRSTSDTKKPAINKGRSKPEVPLTPSSSDSRLTSDTKKPAINQGRSKPEVPLTPSSSDSRLTSDMKKPAINKGRSKPEVHVTPSISDSRLTSDTKKPAINKGRSKPEVPLTPSSSRVSTSQFFPTKNMYSNALKSKDVPIKKSSEETASKVPKTISKIPKTKNSVEKSKIEKPSGRLVRPARSNVIKETVPTEVKQTDSSPLEEENKSMYTSPDSSAMSDRPRTATLRKGSIVNANIVGPDVPKIQMKMVKETMTKLKSPSPKSDSSEEGKYEDDFESYESDFEAYSSSGSTTNVDNISVGDTSSSSSSTSLEEFNSKERKSAQTRILSTSSDEERKLDSGHFDMSDYKHRQRLDNIKESIEKENTNLQLINNPASLSDEGFEEQKSLQFINFLDAKKKYERRKSVESKRKRGKEILNMIRLDSCSFTLFDLAPVSYETFIKSFGKGNTIQTPCQTGDDDVDEEVQTEEICYSTKWTQQPTAFSNFDQEVPDFWQNYKSEFLGVGCENVPAKRTDKEAFNENSLNKFLQSAGELILRIQEESITNDTVTIHKNQKTSPFSDGYCQFNTSKEMFADTKVSCVSFSCDISNRVITVHAKQRSTIVAVWHISNCDEPEVVFSPYGVVTCCSFGIGNYELVFMGMEDGSILVWDAGSKMFSKIDSVTTVPLFATDVSSGHQTKIVSLHHIDTSSEENSYSHQTNELCSLDEDGELILWTIIQKQREENKSERENDIVLVKNTSISLKSLHPEFTDLQCTDFAASNLNSNYLYISTNYGFIIHHLVKGGRSNVRKFHPGSHSIAKCLESCPFSSDYFLSGYDNGNINLYARSSEKPLMILSDKDKSTEYCPIDLIQWSKNKPVVIYTKDAKNRLNIWYLNESDMFPIYSIPFEEEITCMKLSPICEEVENKKSYMMIGTRTGSLYLYQLNEEHGQQSSQVYEENTKTFLNYVNRL